MVNGMREMVNDKGKWQVASGDGYCKGECNVNNTTRVGANVNHAFFFFVIELFMFTVFVYVCDVYLLFMFLLICRSFLKMLLCVCMFMLIERAVLLDRQWSCFCSW